MGTLAFFDLKKIIEDYNIEYFVETGTYLGDGLEYAANFNFNELHSVELLENHYNVCLNRFKHNDKVVLYNENSIEGLKKIVPKIKGNCLFWLDAHLPDFYSGEYTTDYVKNKEISIPLEYEIDIIMSNDNFKNSVIIIDDVRIYETGRFQNGNWVKVIEQDANINLNFIYNKLSDTHFIEKDFNHEGYLICKPKRND